MWRKGDGFLSRLSAPHFLPVTWSFSHAHVDFNVKNCMIGKGNLLFKAHHKLKAEMCCASDNHNYMCHTCDEYFWSIRSSMYAVYVTHGLISNGAPILPQISHFHSNRNWSSTHWCNFLDQTDFIPINFIALTGQEYSFSYGVICWANIHSREGLSSATFNDNISSLNMQTTWLVEQIFFTALSDDSCNEMCILPSSNKHDLIFLE